MSKVDAGPAFPEFRPNDPMARQQSASVGIQMPEFQSTKGMSLRDYFAAAALTGLLGRAWADEKTGKMPENLIEIWAKTSYATADAMIAERDK